MAPTAPEPRPGDAAAPRLNTRIDDAFGSYVARLEEAMAAPGDTAITDTHAAYADEVSRLFTPPDLPQRAWEFYVSYFRALQGVPGPGSAVPRYDALVQAAVDVGLGHQKVLETYQALVTACLQAAPRGDRKQLEKAYGRYSGEVRQAWSKEKPSLLSPTVVLAASQSTWAATSLHGMVLEAVPASDGGPAAPPPDGQADEGGQ